MIGERLAVGASADVHAFGAGRVVKLFRAEYAYIADDEAATTRAVNEAGVPAPAVHGVVEIDGRRGIVLDRFDGPTLLDAITDGSKTTNEAALLLANLHRVMHEASTEALPSWRVVVARVSATLDDTDRRAYESIVAGAPDGAQIYHGDFHPGNVILASGGPVIVDWPNACAAHPAVDVARSLVLLRYQGLTEAIGPPVHDARRAFADAYLAAYLAPGGVEAADVGRSLPLHASGLLRGEPHNAHAAELHTLAEGASDPVVTQLSG